MKRCQLSDLVIPVDTWNPARSDPEESFRYIDLSAIDQEGKSIVGAREIGCAEAPSRARQLVEAGDILVSTVRPNLNGVARVPDELDGATASTGFCVVRPKPESLDGSYLFQWVKSAEFINDMVRKATGASYPAVSDRIVLASTIPLPSLAEQRRIAAILDQADALRAKRREALALLDELQRGIFIEMFGDPATNPKNWPTVAFESLCSRVTVGIVVQPSSYYQPTGVVALRSLNIRPGKIVLGDVVYFSAQDNETRLKKTRLRAGDLVLVRTGQPGTAAVVPDVLDGVNAIDILIATPTAGKCDVAYLCEFFNSKGGRSLVLSAQRGQIQKHLNVGALSAANIPLPPLDMQKEFATRLAVLQKVRDMQLAAIEESDDLFRALQHRGFRGEL